MDDCLFCGEVGCDVCGREPNNIQDIFTKRYVYKQGEHPSNLEDDEMAIEMLERMLQKARAGELYSFALFARTTTEAIISGHTESVFNEPYTWIGMLDEFQTDLRIYLQACKGEDDE